MTSLLLLTGAASGLAGCYDSCYEESESCCSSCSCCCEPHPNQCLDAYGYNPQYYDLNCACGVFIDVEFLYLYGSENLLSYGRKLVDIDSGGSAIVGLPTEFYYLDSEWDPGVRVAIGYNMPCNGWDLSLAWTYYKNTASDKKRVEPFASAQEVGQEILLSNWNGFGVLDFLQANWSFRINQIDLEMGKKYWVSPCFTMRPFAGLRGVWTDTKFRALGERTFEESFESGFLKIAGSYDNETWGFGLLAGLGINWYWTPCFSLYGGADVSLLWGKSEMKRTDQQFEEVTPTGDATEIRRDFSVVSRLLHYHMQPILDVEVGLSYEMSFCDRRFMGMLQLGWEHHYLWEHNLRVPVQGGSEGFSSVGFGGFVLRARFDF